MSTYIKELGQKAKAAAAERCACFLPFRAGKGDKILCELFPQARIVKKQ